MQFWELSKLLSATLAVITSISIAHCNAQTSEIIPTSSVSSTDSLNSTSSVAESWMSKPTADWPQLVLTHFAEFSGHSSLKGASAFLVQNDTKGVFAVTAKHLLGNAGGVEPAISPQDLSKKVVAWNLHPRDNFARIVQVRGEYPQNTAPAGNDIVLLAVKPFEKLPSYPLKVRKTALNIDEEVHLVGCTYDDSTGKQQVYSGKVSIVEKDGYFAYTISPSVNLAGFSGAPIIDKNGHLVGICTIWFRRQMHNGKDLLGGGDSTLALARSIDD